MKAWLKLVGSSDWTLSEQWTIESKDLLREIRFGTAHPPSAISRGDRLVYHAVVHQRIVAIVEVLDDEARLDPTPPEWAKRWPLIRRVRPLIKVRRLSQSPPTSGLGIFDLSYQSYVPLSPAQLQTAEELLKKAGGT